MDESTLLSIKQFSAYTGLRLSTLRYYDEIGILPPVSRGESNNYRYYRPRQIIVANFIQVLVELGIPLSEIKKLSDDRAPEDLIALLSDQEDKLDYLFNKLRTAYSIIHTYRRNIFNGMMAEDGLIRVEEKPEANFIMGPETTFSDGDNTFYNSFIAFCKSAKENRINLKYPVGALHYNMENYRKAPGSPDRFVSLDPFGDFVRPAGKFLVGYKRGYYGQLGDLADRMAEYAAERNLYFHGEVYTVYLLDEVSMTEPNDYLSSVSVRVSNRKTEKRKKIGRSTAETS